MNKQLRVILIAGLVLSASLAHGATISWSSTAPAVNGDDISNFNGTTSDAGNINSGNNAQTVVAGGQGQQGQTFTTGGDTGGYVLMAITLQHVKYSSNTTSYDLGPGWGSGNPFTLRIGTISGGTFTATSTETAAMNSYFPNGSYNDTGSGAYCTLTLDTPIILAPNTTYAFSLDSSNPWFELNGNGTTDANYGGGTAFTATEQSSPAAATTYTGDRVFHLDLAPPVAVISTSPSGYGAPDMPTLEVVIVEYIAELDTNSVALYLDDSPSPIDYINVPEAGQTTIGGTWATALDPGTTHTGMVVYAGINPSVGPFTNTWDFTVELAPDGSHVAWYSSTESESWQRIWDPTLAAGSTSAPSDVVIAPYTTYQTIDGFGGSFNELGYIALTNATSAAQQTAVLEALFSDSGLDFNMARIPIGSSDFAFNIYGSPSTPDDDDYSLAETPGDYALNDFSIERDRRHLLPYIQAAMAVRPDLQCWGSPWSPPEWMKDNNFYAGGSLTWTPQTLTTYANYFVKWIQAYRGEGVNIFAAMAQNEPNQWQVFPSCVWTGAQLAEFNGNYLGPALEAYDPNIKLWFGINGDPQNNGDDFYDRIFTVMSDSNASAYVDAIGFQYDSQNQIALAYELYPDKKLIQTESFCFNGDNTWFDATTRNDGMQGLSRNLQRNFENGANAYFAWNMILDETGLGPWNWRQNAPITVNRSTGKVTYNHEFYIYKHYSYFVKPGAQRIRTTGGWSEKIAFRNPDGSIVLVMANTSTGSQSATISVDGWSGDNVIDVMLPAGSVNTFIFPDKPVTPPDAESSLPATLTHRYSFDETSGSTASDSVGSAHGSLPMGGSWGGGELSLSAGSSQYINLPANLITGYSNVTIEAWVSFPTALPNWCRLFDFGNTSGGDGVNYIFFTPQSGIMRISDSNWSGEEGIPAVQNFSFQNDLHITAVINPPDNRMALYANGVLVGLNNNITLPLSSVNNVYSYIGRSLYASDPYCDMVLDEFRIYDGALTEYEIAATQSLGPDQTLEEGSTPITLDVSAGNAHIQWPVAYASAMMLQSGTNLLEGNWEDQLTLEPTLIGGEWQFSLPLSKTNEFFRLKR